MAPAPWEAYITSMETFPEFCLRNAASLVVTVCVLALGAALLAQYVFDLAPCQLCVYQRWAYVAAGLAGCRPLSRRRHYPVLRYR